MVILALQNMGNFLGICFSSVQFNGQLNRMKVNYSQEISENMTTMKLTTYCFYLCARKKAFL